MFLSKTFIILLLIPSVALASFTVEWGYTPPSSPPVIGYSLYKEGSFVKTFDGASATSGVVDQDITNGDSFTLTAKFSDGTESPHSSTFVYQGILKSSPLIKTITIN